MPHLRDIIILSILTLSIPTAAAAGAEPAPEAIRIIEEFGLREDDTPSLIATVFRARRLRSTASP